MTGETRTTSLFPALLPYSVKVYPILQTIAETGFQPPSRWPPQMNPQLARWKAATSHLPCAGNQLYVHVPFCPFNCHFCPLYKVRASLDKTPEERKRYLDAVIAEIEMYGRVPQVAAQRFNTVYFGGGTPTELTPMQLARIVEALRRNFNITADAEITLEGVAHQFRKPEYLAACVDRGFNRISFGAESLDQDVRKRIGRGDQVSDYPALLEMARRDFPGLTVNVDLMAGLPLQTLGSLTRDVAAVVNWEPDSIDMFYFVLLPGTRLYDLVCKRKAPPPADGKLLLAMRRFVNFALPEAGYRPISGEVFSRTDRDLFTRTSLGDGGNGLNTVVALGPSAFGILDGTIYQNVCDLRLYEEGVQRGVFPVLKAKTLDAATARRRALLLGLLRLEVPGALIDTPALRRRVKSWMERGLVQPSTSGFRLTPEGRNWYNHLQIEILPLLDTLKVARLFGSVEEQISAARMFPKNPLSHRNDLLRHIRYHGRFGCFRYLAYLMFLQILRLPFFRHDAVGFTGPVGR